MSSKKVVTSVWKILVIVGGYRGADVRWVWWMSGVDARASSGPNGEEEKLLFALTREHRPLIITQHSDHSAYTLCEWMNARKQPAVDSME